MSAHKMKRTTALLCCFGVLLLTSGVFRSVSSQSGEWKQPGGGVHALLSAVCAYRAVSAHGGEPSVKCVWGNLAIIMQRNEMNHTNNQDIYMPPVPGGVII